MLLTFKPMVLKRALGLKPEWETELAKVGMALDTERAAVYV